MLSLRQWFLWLFLWASHLSYADIPSKMAFTRVIDDAAAKPLGGVNSIAQDRQGFMWFAGESGLGRFDGHQVRFFPADVDDPYALNSNYIRSLLLDHDGVLWVATEAGLCRYQTSGDRFNCDLPGDDLALPLTTASVTVLALAPDNTLYVGGVAGLYVLSPDRQQLRHIGPPAGVAVAGARLSVMDITLDRSGTVWVATTDVGLMQFRPQGLTDAPTLTQTAALRQQAGDRIKAVHVDPLDRLWIGTTVRAFLC